MKKLYAGIIVGIFLLSTFLALNLYSSTSYIGYGQNETCNNCHNQPAFVKPVDSISFPMNNFSQAENAFMANGNNKWATDEVPVVQTNNRSATEFIQMTFLKNTTDVLVRAQVPDPTYTVKGTGSAHSDKFGIIFNIDVANFSVGDFLINYNSTANVSLDNVLTGQMQFPNGTADLWYVDVNNIGVNQTGMAQDEFISTGIASDGASHQDVHVGIWYGDLGHGSIGYRFYFVRKLNTNDPNDARFDVDGMGINYAIASWNDNSTYYHHSSFDQMVIVGNKIGVTTIGTTTITNNFNYTTTFTEQASIGSSLTAFSVVIILAIVAIAVPVVTFFIRPRNK